MAPEDSSESSDILHAIEAAERAGAIVTEQVRSIVDAAEERAAEIRRQAEEDAQRIRDSAAEAAMIVLQRIDGVEGQLGELVADLRSEAERLSSSGASE